MFPGQCQRGVTGGAVSAKPALIKRETPTHTHPTATLCLSWAFSPIARIPPSVLSVKTYGKYNPAS